MRITALFLGFSESRPQNVVSSIERKSSVRIRRTAVHDPGDDVSELVSDFDVIFVNRAIKSEYLERLLGVIRDQHQDIPIVITYGSEPDGTAFQLARKYDCWLFSEKDRLERTLQPAEIGETLAMRVTMGSIGRRLIEVGLGSGPCSTGA